MSLDWEQKFRNWGKPPGKTEQEKCDNAERAIHKAIGASERLNDRNITIFPKGSYPNRTNVRTDSDVDICVLCTDSFFFDLPSGMTSENFGITVPATYQYYEYKNDVENALVNHFGRNAVDRGNKAFDINENTYRVNADVVACFEYKWYYSSNTLPLIGEAFDTDFGARVVNWSNQNYNNGVEKNRSTSRRFKASTRILKALRSEMVDYDYLTAKDISSFLIECLVWNVPNECFGKDKYIDDVRNILIYLFGQTQSLDNCADWKEINDIKYIFDSQTQEQVNKFIVDAWHYVGFE